MTELEAFLDAVEWTSPTREIPDAGVSASEAVTRYIKGGGKDAELELALFMAEVETPIPSLDGRPSPRQHNGFHQHPGRAIARETGCKFEISADGDWGVTR